MGCPGEGNPAPPPPSVSQAQATAGAISRQPAPSPFYLPPRPPTSPLRIPRTELPTPGRLPAEFRPECTRSLPAPKPPRLNALMAANQKTRGPLLYYTPPSPPATTPSPLSYSVNFCSCNAPSRPALLPLDHSSFATFVSSGLCSLLTFLEF